VALNLRFWIEEWQRLKPNAFAAIHGHPWLILSQEPEGAIAPAQTARFNRSEFQKEELSLEALQPDMPTYPLRRRGSGERISVGRSRRNDIVVGSSSVSKLHAYFELRGDVWYLEDADSRNGTWVETLRLEPGVAVPLRDEATVWLAEVTCRFILPETMYSLLAEGAERLGARPPGL
jgi:hypothetical protein